MSKEIINRDILMVTATRFLENEYGEGAVEVLARWKDERNRKRWREISESTGRSDPEYLFRLFSDVVHDYEVIRIGPDALEVMVNWCLHAETFQRFSATDVGMKMICLGDFAVVEGFNPDIDLRRPKTLMTGDDCCHFIFELK